MAWCPPASPRGFPCPARSSRHPPPPSRAAWSPTSSSTSANGNTTAGRSPFATRSRGCAQAAHPRMRGDHALMSGCATRTRGPPPHARGSPGALHLPRHARRPTPACAGITTRSPCCSITSVAHPRMRGDHDALRRLVNAVEGPPPHARGSRLDGERFGGEDGPTPACAGITKAVLGSLMIDKAHPRMRGDHGAISAMRASYSGPPPHARGSPYLTRHARPPLRPTPACAGITATAACG